MTDDIKSRVPADCAICHGATALLTCSTERGDVIVIEAHDTPEGGECRMSNVSRPASTPEYVQELRDKGQAPA